MKKILLIQTGGTIAMAISPENAPELDAKKGSAFIYQKIPELSNMAAIETICPFFKDSSDVGPAEWKQLIKCIAANYNTYDGFVILHGTDTMAYCASALSFGLQNLSKPVIFTGSQIPMAVLRSDARRNLVNAVEIATQPLPEVAICFNDFVYRGNRSAKMSIGDFDAFISPNYPPLAEIGLNIELHKANIRKVSGESLLTFTNFSDDILLIKVHPALTHRKLQRYDLNGTRAVLIEAFGSGNFPLMGDDGLLPFLRNCIDEGIEVVITSQAPYDAVDLSKYESGRAAAGLGALSAGDMTTEAALAKIMYILGNDSGEAFEQQFQSDVSGEITN